MNNCFRCGIATELAHENDSSELLQPVCIGCVLQANHVQAIREMAADIKAGDFIRLETRATDVFPEGNTVYPSRLFLNLDGFGFPDENYSDSGTLEWFEWGTQLYAGPKSYNKYEELRKYREALVRTGIEDTSARSEEDLDESHLEFEGHYLSQQLIGFVITCGSDSNDAIDKWITAKYSLNERPFHGDDLPGDKWLHAHELNDLILLLQDQNWEDENSNPIPANVGVAEELESRAKLYERLSGSDYLKLSKLSLSYNERQYLPLDFRGVMDEAKMGLDELTRMVNYLKD